MRMKRKCSVCYSDAVSGISREVVVEINCCLSKLILSMSIKN